MARNKPNGNGNSGNLGFEAELFKTADKLRGNMEPSDYKHVALGLIFLKYISDAFEAKHKALLSDDVQADMSRNARFPILTTKSIQEDFGKNIPYLQGKNLKAIFLSEPAAPVPPSQFGTDGSTLSQEAFQKVMKNGVDVNTALREADEKLNQKIAAAGK